MRYLELQTCMGSIGEKMPMELALIGLARTRHRYEIDAPVRHDDKKG